MKRTYKGSKSYGNMHSATIDGEYMGTGPQHLEKDMGIQKGDTIEFETEFRGRFTNIKVDTVKKVAAGNGNNKTNSKSYKSGNSRDAYWEQKAETDKEVQLVIQSQSSRNSAIETVKVMLEHGLVSVPQKKADKYDFVLALIDKVAAKYNTEVEMTKEYGLNTGSSEVIAQEETDELE